MKEYRGLKRYILVLPADLLFRTPPLSSLTSCFCTESGSDPQNRAISLVYPWSRATKYNKTLSAFVDPSIGSIIIDASQCLHLFSRIYMTISDICQTNADKVSWASNNTTPFFGAYAILPDITTSGLQTGKLTECYIEASTLGKMLFNRSFWVKRYHAA